MVEVSQERQDLVVKGTKEKETMEANWMGKRVEAVDQVNDWSNEGWGKPFTEEQAPTYFSRQQQADAPIFARVPGKKRSGEERRNDGNAPNERQIIGKQGGLKDTMMRCEGVEIDINTSSGSIAN